MRRGNQSSGRSQRRKEVPGEWGGGESSPFAATRIETGAPSEETTLQSKHLFSGRRGQGD